MPRNPGLEDTIPLGLATRVWVRVRGVSKASVGPWSQPAGKVVP